jgi:GDPmannose 4,6-dehydratase
VKRALIVGSAGQDGRILTRQLRSKGTAVVGLDRGPMTIDGHDGPLPSELAPLIKAFVPDAVFYLAAYHHSSQDNLEQDVVELFRQSFAVHVDRWVELLGALKAHAPEARAFYAASSHVFGAPPTGLQDETTPLAPDSAYGISKTAGLQVARFFRARGQHVSVGILYNHESELRGEQFVSTRIVKGAVRAAAAQRKGEAFKLELGSFSSVVDWGYAPDYTEAMQHIVSGQQSDDYVIATGVPHTVADFCRVAFEAVGLDWTKHVVERPSRVTKVLAPFVGDASRLREATGWKPTVSFEQMVGLLVAAARAGEPA